MVNGILDGLGAESAPEGVRLRRDARWLRAPDTSRGRHLGEFELIARYFAPLANDAAALALARRCRRAQAAREPGDRHLLRHHRRRRAFPARRSARHDRAQGARGEFVGSRRQGGEALRLSPGAGASCRSPLRRGSRASPRACASFKSKPASAWSAATPRVRRDLSPSPSPRSASCRKAMPCSGSAPSRATGSMSAAASAMPVSAFACCKEPALAAAWDLSEEDRAFLIGRYRRPEPRSNLALLVRNFAQGAIDVSDGLVGDVREARAGLPCRRRDRGRARAVLVRGAKSARSAIRSFSQRCITAGDDYEIVAAVPEASAAAFEAEAAAKGATRHHDRPHRGPCRRGEGAWPRRRDAQAGAHGIRPFLAPDQCLKEKCLKLGRSVASALQLWHFPRASYPSGASGRGARFSCLALAALCPRPSQSNA